MAMWINDYVKKNKYSRPGMKLEKVKGVILHYTANPSATAKNHADFFDGDDGGAYRYAGCHLFVDKKEKRLIVPLSEVCYHANDKTSKVSKLGKNANFSTVGIEMCIEKNGSIHKDTYAKTLELTIHLCKKYKLDEDDLYRHYDITGKNCPKPWVENPKEWTKFKADVKKGLNPPKKSTPAPPKNESSEGTVKVLVNELWYYNKPDWKAKAGLTKKNDVFTVIDTLTVNGSKMLKLKSGNYLTANTKYVKFTKK